MNTVSAVLDLLVLADSACSELRRANAHMEELTTLGSVALAEGGSFENSVRVLDPRYRGASVTLPTKAFLGSGVPD